MVRRLLVVGVVGLLALGAAACSDDDAGDGGGDDAATTTTATLPPGPDTPAFAAAEAALDGCAAAAVGPCQSVGVPGFAELCAGLGGDAIGEQPSLAGGITFAADGAVGRGDVQCIYETPAAVVTLSFASDVALDPCDNDQITSCGEVGGIAVGVGIDQLRYDIAAGPDVVRVVLPAGPPETVAEVAAGVARAVVGVELDPAALLAIGAGEGGAEGEGGGGG